MHHKRGRPKSSRAGCLMCKPWKHQGASGSRSAQTEQELRARDAERDALLDYYEELEERLS